MGSFKLAGYIPGRDVYRNSGDMYSPDYGLGDRPNKDSLPVGRILTVSGKRYKIVEAELRANCKGCVFHKDRICHKGKKIRTPCSAYSRSDKTWVIFKELNKDGTFK